MKQSSIKSLKNSLPDKISLRLLGLEFKSDNTMKSKAVKYIALFCTRLFWWSCYYLQLLLFSIIIQNIGLSQKLYYRTNNIKMENNKLKKVTIKNRTCYFFNGIIKSKDLILMIFSWIKTHRKIFWFMTFCLKSFDWKSKNFSY